MMKPSLGRIVLVAVDPAQNNGSDVAPAVVTRVFSGDEVSGWVINVRVLLDGTDVPWRTSQRLIDEPDAPRVGIAWWPPRV